MLTVRNLHCSYGTAEILSGVEFDLELGEVLAILGRNGIGKTTLVRAVAGLRPPTITSGEVIYRGERLDTLESYEVARKGIGYVPQGRRIFGSLTVLENLEVIAQPADNGSGWTVDRVFEFFPRLGERVASYGRNLSGGEQQMLAIGRALMTNPSLLLMDEPSEGLAPIVLATIRDRLLELKGQDLSILLVEQNLGLAMSLADRIVILGPPGRIVWSGRPDQLDAAADIKQTYLGV
ncbi:MAG TPA: ABC transporter ATP-binding protein [Acidimicrobiia bacterium]|jgi:branched-chain amino acid transport system ATP-binding protein